MRLPAIQGVIDRRILLNYRIDSEVVARALPAPFRPKTIRGFGIGGICLIRLTDLRLKLLPTPIGLRSENAAHRFAVEWDEQGQTHEGVYIPRRDSDSKLSSVVGGRLFPGVHHHAQFHVHEEDDRLELQMESDDGRVRISVKTKTSDALPDNSVFESIEEVSAFFENGSLGYSDTKDPTQFDGLELRCNTWSVQPLNIESATSSYFENHEIFPKGSATIDCALLMQGIEHEWHARDSICCTDAIG